MIHRYFLGLSNSEAQRDRQMSKSGIFRDRLAARSPEYWYGRRPAENLFFDFESKPERRDATTAPASNLCTKLKLMDVARAMTQAKRAAFPSFPPALRNENEWLAKQYDKAALELFAFHCGGPPNTRQTGKGRESTMIRMSIRLRPDFAR
jgi:hypothetical protein